MTDGRAQQRSDGFALAYDNFEPAQEGLREALTSTGNGHFCTRGACEWQDADDVHYPGTYAHGAYNRETTILRGQPVLNEDLGDVQGGTTKEGIHMGVMSGTLDLVQRRYAGTDIRDGVLRLEPRLRDRLQGVTFSMQYRGTPLRVRIAGDELTVSAPGERFDKPVRVGVGEDVRELCAGDQCTFVLPGRAAAAHSGR